MQQIGAVKEGRECLNGQDKLEFRGLDSHSCTRDCLRMEHSVYNGCDFSVLTDRKRDSELALFSQKHQELS